MKSLSPFIAFAEKSFLEGGTLKTNCRKKLFLDVKKKFETIFVENWTDRSSLTCMDIMDSNQKWKTQIQGSGGTISNLNSRLYLIRRLSRVISQDRMRRISDSLYTSKIRYGVQLFGKVRLNEQDPTESLLESLQTTQNKQ